ncbi:hypothetical protein [Janthinobacterium sp. HH01]|uniref:hypothetical protein n=1 Tax=Janthinobacterium sp. HH01 TaxID=1198452 RepID=UPI0012692A80|nr:hypothetical protein [Janthinobacterium sp. HH01]
MKPLIALVFAALSSSSALACQTPTPESLRAAWITWRAAALKDEPGASARLYKFPFLLLSAYQGDRPLRVTKAGFNDNYLDLFGAELQFRQELQQTTDSEHIGKIDFDEKACKLKFPVRVHDTNFTYDQKAGWLVQSIYMPGAYSIFNKGDTEGIR